MTALKDEVIAVLRDLTQLAEKAGLGTLAHELHEVRIPKVRDERFNLVVLGEFNHGKTSFVNRLLGTDVLPTGITPTTAALTHVVWGDKSAARVVLDDGSEQSLKPKQLAEWVSVAAQAERARYVELSWPADFLRDNVTLVDTPGVNDINEQRADITYGYVPRADAVVFLLDATQILKASERLFLEQRVFERSRDRLIFAVAKADLLDSDELRQAVAYAQGHLSRLVPEPLVFPFSAKTGFGIDALRAQLDSMLKNDRARHLLDHAIADGQRTTQFVRQSVGMREQALTLDIGELEARVARVRVKLDVSAAMLKQHQDRIRTEAAAIAAVAGSDLDEFKASFLRALPNEIEQASAADIKRHLQPFIADTFKSWAELEGDKIGARLEELAEAIIQLTNENVKETMETLQGAFGPADTKVELQVDTLKYDVGVFALGAFGTTIFLFVNTFIGGLLTVATPILAVVVKAKVDREVKEQAKERAPEVIEKAAAALAPKLRATVNDFADRLLDFVANAGAALARSVEEVLERALAERRAAGADAAAVREQLVGYAAALEQLSGRLATLREQLWGSSSG
jgi:small GTP-binding protein